MGANLNLSLLCEQILFRGIGSSETHRRAVPPFSATQRVNRSDRQVMILDRNSALRSS
jgi:hypothetical protein